MSRCPRCNQLFWSRTGLSSAGSCRTRFRKSTSKGSNFGLDMRLTALLCPSALPEMPQGRVFGVMGGTATEPRLAYLDEPAPVTDDILAMAEPVKPTEV